MTCFVAAIVGGAVSTTAMAHDAFKEPMQKRYGLKTVSCKVCHPNNKDRSIRNAFGEYYAQALKGQDMTKKFDEASEKGEEAQKAYEKEMVKAFIEAMQVVEKKPITIEEWIKTGMLNGTRLDTKKSGGKSSDDDDEDGDGDKDAGQ